MNHLGRPIQADSQAGFEPLSVISSSDREDGFDPVDAYFECISTCSLDDGDCITVCTTMLRDQN